MALSKQDIVRPGQPAKNKVRPPRLSPQEEFSKIMERYKEKARNKANFLIVGPHGTGKTYNMINAPGPVLIHSFDPNGTECIPDEYIANGHIIPDTQFEDDSVTNPRAFRRWEAEFTRLRRSEIFDHVGTYVLDSFSRWQMGLMWEILKARGRRPPSKVDLSKDPDIVPELSDYNVHQKTMAQCIGDIVSLPCNTVVIAHMRVRQDDLTGEIQAQVLMEGSAYAQLIPTMFDEVYYALSKPAGADRRYVYRLVNRTIFAARSRLRKDGKILQPEEPQNIRDILKRSGYPWQDKTVPEEE